MNGMCSTAIGVISGTSMDGIDVSLVETDGDRFVRTGPGLTIPYPDALRRELLGVIAEPEQAIESPMVELEEAVTDSHIAAIERFMAAQGLTPRNIDVIGFHGQTVYHRPDRRFTRQLGLGGRVAARLGIDTVDRFRQADVAAGGQGAPLVPLYHRALATGMEQPLAVLNLGGVANVTYLDRETVTAFDTGPASALLDDFMRRRREVPYDADGALAASGSPDAGLLEQFLNDPFFARPAPKSLDRQDFRRYAEAVEALSDADGAATLAAFTVESVAAALRHLPQPPRRWLVTGGGRRNAWFMRQLGHRLKVPVDPVEAVGWDGDFLEAQAFGFMAVRSVRGLPLSLPSTTGVPQPTRGGELHKASR